MVKGVVNDSSHEITKIYHDGREIERVCDIYGNVLYLSSKTVTGAASLSFKNRKESTRNVVGFSVETSSSDIESINAFMLSKLFIGKQNSTSYYFGVYLPEPGSYEITLPHTDQTYNFVSDGDVNTYFFINLGYGAVGDRDIDIYVEKQDGQFDFTKVKYAVFDTIYYDDRYDILNEHPVRFDNSIESYIIYGNNLNGVHVGDYDENSGNYMLPISIHGKNLFNVEDFFSSSIDVVRGNMSFYEYTQEQVAGVLIQAENNDCYTMPYYQIPCKPGQYYTLSWYSDNNNPGLVYIFFYDSDETKISQVYADNANSKQLTFLVPENTVVTKVRLGVANAGDNIAYTNIQLERGQTKTNYISYQDPVMHTVSLDEPLRKIGNELEYIQKRKSVTNGILHRVTQKTSNTAPLTFASTGQALKNYRIYGNTINGENVGDRTANLFANLWKKGYIRADNGREEQTDGFICSGFFPVEYGQTYSISRNINVGYDNIRGYRDDGSFIGAGTDICDVSNPFPGAATNIGVFTVTNENVAFIRFNDSANDLGMKYMIVEGTYTEQTMPDYEPYGYRVPVTVEGKNLFDKSKPANILKCYLSVSNLVSSVDTRTIFIECKPSTTYTVSKIRGKRFVVGWSDKLPAPGVELQEKVINYDASSITITTGLAAKYLVAYIYNAEQDAPITVDEMIASVQIEKCSTATPYEPYHTPVTTPIYLPEPLKMVGGEAEYIDYQEQKLHRVRKNLLQNTASSQTKNGVTFTVNNDGSVTCDGTASDTTWFVLNNSFDIYAPDGGIISIGNDGSTSTFYMNVSYVGNITSSYNYSKNIHQNVYVQLVITAGYNCDNLTFYPMIRKAAIEDDTYEPYIENTELNAELPELQTVEGTNTLSIRTSVQPSQVLVEAMYPNDSYILTPEISTFEDINTITVNTEIPPESISITGKIGPIS